MFATIIAIVLTLVFHSYLNLIPSDLALIWIGVAGSIFLLATPLIKGFSIIVIQKANRHISSQILAMSKENVILSLCHLIWIGFIVFSFALVAFGVSQWLIAWLIFLGVAIDATTLYTGQITRLIDPTALLTRMTIQAKNFFDPLKQTELSHTIDAIAEVGLKSVREGSAPLANQAITTLASIGEEYGKGARGEGAIYILGFLMHRLQMIYNAAAEEHNEPIANQVILSTTKLVLSGAKENSAMASLPLHFLNSFILRAEEFQLAEVFTNGSIILFELAKSLVAHPELKGKEVSGLLFVLIERMDEFGKDEFKRDKKTPISVIRQPFQDLKDLIKQRSDFPNASAVVARLDRILLEYQELDRILTEIPNIPGYNKPGQQ